MDQKNIGFLTYDIGGTYNQTMWKYISNAANDKNFNIITFCGGFIERKSNKKASWSKIFDLPDSQNISGLVVLSAPISESCEVSDIIEMLSRFKNIPIVSIGHQIEGMASVTIDNESGMNALMDHLITEHDIKKPLILMGPKTNIEAMIRYKTSVDKLKEYGYNFDKEYLKYGNFRHDQSYEIVNSASKELKFDSIIAQNDDMAFGAIESLLDSGFNLPTDILVTGFDDSESVQSCPVPLTTVRQPHKKLAYKSIELLSDIINNKTENSEILLPSELVIRKSCGCFTKSLKGISEFSFNIYDLTLEEYYKHEYFTDPKMSDLLDEEHVLVKNPKLFRKLFLEYKKIIDTGNNRPFLNEFDQIINSTARNDSIIYQWYDFISGWQAISFHYFRSDLRMLTLLTDTFIEARHLISSMELHWQEISKHKSQQKDFLLYELNLFSSYFSPIMNYESFLEYLKENLPRFGISGFYVNIFDKQDNDKCKNIMHFISDGSSFSDADAEFFPSSQLLPNKHRVGANNNYIINPLINYEELIGFTIFVCDKPPPLLENIEQIISKSLITLLLIQEILRDKHLKELMSNLEKKQKELQTAYKQLKENQETMLIIEKMASLGRMTAGIAHEMNSPIAAVRAALTEIKDLASEYKDSIGDKDVSDSDHEEISNELLQAISLAEIASEKAASFVHSIKSQTRDLSPKEQFNFNSVTVIEEALLLVSHAAKKSNCNIEFKNKSDYIELHGVPGRLAQVITNLINNSIEAGNRSNNLNIIIELSSSDDKIILSVEDNGSGIAEENITRIFDPMFTTKPFGIGTGLGLTLVHDIVTADFGGKIDIESKVGVGTKFIMCFPAV